MKLLIDSHVLLWWLADDPQLSRTAADLIDDGANEVLVSAASIWEIEIKRVKGKLPAPDDLVEQVRISGFDELAVSASHGRDAARLPDHHGDPFDRVLVAQARAEGATLVTADAALAAYDVPLLRVR